MRLEKIQYVSPKIPELVMQALISAIESGQIRVGEELPSERDLAEHLGVGRGSLRECLAILEFLGAIENRGSRKKVARDADYIRRAASFVRISNQLEHSCAYGEAYRQAVSDVVRTLLKELRQQSAEQSPCGRCDT